MSKNDKVQTELRVYFHLNVTRNDVSPVLLTILRQITQHARPTFLKTVLTSSVKCYLLDYFVGLAEEALSLLTALTA